MSKLNSLSFVDSFVTKMIYDVHLNKRYFIFMYMIIKKVYQKTFYFEFFNLDRLFYCPVYVGYHRLQLLDWTRHDCLNNIYRKMKYELLNNKSCTVFKM